MEREDLLRRAAPFSRRERRCSSWGGWTRSGITETSSSFISGTYAGSGPGGLRSRPSARKAAGRLACLQEEYVIEVRGRVPAGPGHGEPQPPDRRSGGVRPETGDPFRCPNPPLPHLREGHGLRARNIRPILPTWMRNCGSGTVTWTCGDPPSQELLPQALRDHEGHPGVPGRAQLHGGGNPVAHQEHARRRQGLPCAQPGPSRAGSTPCPSRPSSSNSSS